MTYSLSRYLEPKGQFAVIAHRGGGAEAPENTIAAFTHAHEIYAASIFELDVHLTQDNQVVVIHDDRIDRTTNGNGFVKDFSYSELERYDAGFHFSKDGGQTFPFRAQHVKVPLLSEVLEKFPDTRVSIEIKITHPHVSRHILEVVDQYKARARVVLAGEKHSDLTAARHLAPDICSGYSAKEVFWTLVAHRTGLGFLAPSCGQVYQVPFKHHERPLVTEDFVKKAHRRGKAVHVWTINDEATMRHLLQLGVDGIITDAPSLLVRVAQEFKKI